MNNQELKALIDESPFTRSCYNVSVMLKNFHDMLMMYISDEKYKGGYNPEDIFLGVPDFQRDNDKWSVEMQTKFIENILLGCKTTIMMYEISDTSYEGAYCNCKILDGLQRTTAIHLFLTGNLKAFGKTYEELKEVRAEINLNLIRCRIELNIYTFKTYKEAVEFYISINEYMTHSDEDIKKARDCINGV